MTIEVRQLLVHASVGGPVQHANADHADFQPGSPRPADTGQLREELLAELKAWLELRLDRLKER